MTYQDVLARLGEKTEADVLTVYRRFVAGELDRARAEAIITRIIVAANLRAEAVADLGLSAQLTVELGTEVPASAEAASTDPVRLRKASSTVLEVAAQSPVPEAIVARLARAEPLEAAARRLSDGISRDKRVKGWVRVMETDACQLCEWWWREGREWPAIHPMQTHKGCMCTQRVVVRKEIQETGFSKRVKAAEEHAEARQARRSK